jgi:hypothetical protein
MLNEILNDAKHEIIKIKPRQIIYGESGKQSLIKTIELFQETVNTTQNKNRVLSKIDFTNFELTTHSIFCEELNKAYFDSIIPFSSSAKIYGIVLIASNLKNSNIANTKSKKEYSIRMELVPKPGQENKHIIQGIAYGENINRDNYHDNKSALNILAKTVKCKIEKTRMYDDYIRRVPKSEITTINSEESMNKLINYLLNTIEVTTASNKYIKDLENKKKDHAREISKNMDYYF